MDATPIGASVVEQPSLSQDTSQELAGTLAEEIRQMREETKSMFQAMSQRADTDAEASHAGQNMFSERCQTMEKHFLDSLKLESTSMDALQK